MTESSGAVRLTRQRVMADVAELLDIEVGDLDTEEDLVDAGLDSIRIMSLVERWQSAGSKVTFVDLAESPTLGQWLTVLRV